MIHLILVPEDHFIFQTTFARSVILPHFRSQMYKQCLSFEAAKFACHFVNFAARVLVNENSNWRRAAKVEWARERELKLRLHNSGPLSHFPKNRKKEMHRNRQDLTRYFTLFAALKRV